MKNKNQAQMFATADLPLFSGTAIKTVEKGFVAVNVDFQARLLSCPICLGTGKYKNGTHEYFCACEIGRKAKGKTKFHK